ncbi:MAG TPA: hypothetical protein VGF99_18665, partial [Myxococcota bacterium]
DVSFVVADADGDAVSVDVYLAVTAGSFDGVLVRSGIVGEAGTARVSLTGVPPAVWHVFAVATDPRGGIAYASAPGTVEVLPSDDNEASFRLIEPDGVGDVDADGIVLITWEASVPLGQTGAIALSVDDGNGNEIGIAGGLPASPVVDGVAPSRSYALDTATLAPGQYTVRGVMSHIGGDIRSEADGVIVVSADGCAQVSRGVSGGTAALPIGVLLAMLAVLVAARRREREVLIAPSPGGEEREGG